MSLRTIDALVPLSNDSLRVGTLEFLFLSKLLNEFENLLKLPRSLGGKISPKVIGDMNKFYRYKEIKKRRLKREVLN